MDEEDIEEMKRSSGTIASGKELPTKKSPKKARANSKPPILSTDASNSSKNLSIEQQTNELEEGELPIIDNINNNNNNNNNNTTTPLATDRDDRTTSGERRTSEEEELKSNQEINCRLRERILRYWMTVFTKPAVFHMYEK